MTPSFDPTICNRFCVIALFEPDGKHLERVLWQLIEFKLKNGGDHPQQEIGDQYRICNDAPNSVLNSKGVNRLSSAYFLINYKSHMMNNFYKNISIFIIRILRDNSVTYRNKKQFPLIWIWNVECFHIDALCIKMFINMLIIAV